MNIQENISYKNRDSKQNLITKYQKKQQVIDQ